MLTAIESQGNVCLFFSRFTSAQLDRFYVCDVCKIRNEYSWSQAAWLEHTAFMVCIVDFEDGQM